VAPSASLRYYRRRAAEYQRKGLTTRGRPRRRRPNGCPQSREVLRRDNLDSYHRRAARFAAQGLTTRGTPRKRWSAVCPNPQRQPRYMTAREWAWRRFRAGLAIRVPDPLEHLKLREVA